MSDSPIAAVFTHEGGTVAAAWFGSPPPEPEPGICALTGAWSEQTWPRDIIVSSNFTRGDWLGRPDSDRFSAAAVCAFRLWGPIRVGCSRWNPKHSDRVASIITPNGVTDIPRGAGYPDTLPEVSVLIMPLTRQQHVLPQRGVVWGTYVTEQGVVPQRPVTHQALLRFRTLRAAGLPEAAAAASKPSFAATRWLIEGKTGTKPVAPIASSHREVREWWEEMTPLHREPGILDMAIQFARQPAKKG